jgi:hypothetical protein
VFKSTFSPPPAPLLGPSRQAQKNCALSASAAAVVVALAAAAQPALSAAAAAVVLAAAIRSWIWMLQSLAQRKQ